MNNVIHNDLGTLFPPNQDLLLVELPMRYVPMIPNGVGYLHNALKINGVKSQIIDANIIIYHRYHERKRSGAVTAGTFKGVDDPWSSSHASKWQSEEAIDFFKADLQEVIEGIVQAVPAAVGFSINLANRVIVRYVVGELRRRLPGLPLIVGEHSCVSPIDGPKLFTDFDYMCIFDSELTLPDLIKRITAGERPRDLPGVISKNDTPGRRWINTPIVTDLSSLPFPHYDWVENIDIYRDINKNIVVPITPSRGCK